VVINDTQFILHLVPSGILHEGKLSLIGNGTVVEPESFLKEIDELEEQGIHVGDNLCLSNSAHLIMPYHIAIETASESRRGKGAIGTTGRGIGPAYVDKMNRTGIKVGDLLYPEIFRDKLDSNLAFTNSVLEKVFGAKGFKTDDIFKDYMRYGERLASHIADTDIIVNDALDGGKKVLFEGAQGTLLDIDHGTYPFVTSSSATAGGVCTGLGVSPVKINKILGVVKAYTTRVGSGPFPTEQENPIGERLREKGGEYGATTGRPRRCGWLDMVALRHSIRINGLTGIVLTKLDVLDGFDEIKICTSYKCDSETVSDFPKEAALLSRCTPVYESVTGWKESTNGLTSFGDLPREAKDYIKTIEEMLGVEVQIVSTGPKRDQLIMIKEQF
jgi:adenylosuccinate synthase